MHSTPDCRLPFPKSTMYHTRARHCQSTVTAHTHTFTHTHIRRTQTHTHTTQAPAPVTAHSTHPVPPTDDSLQLAVPEQHHVSELPVLDLGPELGQISRVQRLRVGVRWVRVCGGQHGEWYGGTAVRRVIQWVVRRVVSLDTCPECSVCNGSDG